MTGLLRSGLPLLRRAVAVGNLSGIERSVGPMAALYQTVSKPESCGHSMQFSKQFSFWIIRKQPLCVNTGERLRTSDPPLPRFLWEPLRHWGNFARTYASGPPAKQQNVKVPLKMYGASGNYATALYIAAVKANTLDKVESELNTLVEAAKKSPTFYLFLKDVSVTADTRVKALSDICAHAKFSDITRNFLG
ncbi:hypothetical protein OROGR_004023 [Orobanche gracilis]